jgi:hypothetical protein
MSSRARRPLLALCAAALALGLGGCDRESCTRPPQNGLEALFTAFICFGANFPEPTDPPVARLSIDPPIAESGQPVRFDASASTFSGRGRFEWDLDGDSRFEVDSGSEPVITRTFTVETGIETRVINLRVTDDEQRSSSVPGILTIRAATGLRAVLTARPNPVRPRQSVLFDASGSTGAIAYEWDLDGDGVFERAPSPAAVREFVYETAGTRRVTVGVFDSVGGRATASVDVVVTEARAAVANRRPALRARLTRVRLPDGLGTPRQRGSQAALRGVVVTGRLSAPRRGLGALRPFRRARWIARLNLTADVARRTARVRGHALVRFGRGKGRVCVRITAADRSKGPPAGRMKLLGGTGDAARLRGGGRFRYRFRGTTPVPAGRLAAELGHPRPMPTACDGLDQPRP